MEFLEVTDSSSEMCGTRKCYLGPRCMDDIGLKLADWVKIQTKCCSFLCSVWPRRDRSEGYIQFDPTILHGGVTELSSKCLIENRKMTQHNFTVQKIEKIESDKLNSVTVSVIFEDYREVNKYRKFTSSDDLKRKLSSILRTVCVCAGSVVKCQRLNVGKLHQISYIVVHQISGKAEYGMVATKTKFKIENISSKDRFEQKVKRSSIKKLGGLSRQKDILIDTITLPFKYPNAQQKLGIQFNRGVLLRGPAGCGKTSLVRFVAAETEAYLEYVNGADVCGGRPGEGEGKLRQIFHKAISISEDGPCILFIDEVDALCPQKGVKGSGGQERRLVSQLMTLLDSLHEKGNLVVIGATNRPQALDPSLRRAGRFDKEIFIGIAKLEQRKEILDVLAEGINFADEVQLNKLAEATPGYTGADLASIVQQAVLDAYVRAADKDSFRTTQADLEKALHSTVPSTQRGSDILVDYRPVFWDEIGGLEDVKQQLKQAVEWPLKHPDAFARLGIPRPSGVLLYGPPGCAKTTLVRAAATSCHVTFLAISGAQLFSPFVGDSEKKLSEAFQQARAGAPSILFIDEIESLVGKRSSGAKQRGAQERVLSTLLNEMDGIGLRTEDLQQAPAGHMIPEGESQEQKLKTETKLVDNNDVLLVVATNRPDMIDEALLRPGRVDRLIFVPLPDKQARHRILEVYTKNIPTLDVNLDELADMTEGFTGADIENFSREAALHALTLDGINAEVVHQRHFLECLKTIRPSLTADEIGMYSNLLKK